MNDASAGSHSPDVAPPRTLRSTVRRMVATGRPPQLKAAGFAYRTSTCMCTGSPPKKCKVSVRGPPEAELPTHTRGRHVEDGPSPRAASQCASNRIKPPYGAVDGLGSVLVRCTYVLRRSRNLHFALFVRQKTKTSHTAFSERIAPPESPSRDRSIAQKCVPLEATGQSTPWIRGIPMDPDGIPASRGAASQAEFRSSQVSIIHDFCGYRCSWPTVRVILTQLATQPPESLPLR